MKTVTLLYHDAVGDRRWDSSGRAGRAASRYKLDWPDFESHLEALAQAAIGPPSRVWDLLSQRVSGHSWMLTFDDGGSSAPRIGEALAQLGWRGHFFVTTDWIDRPGFVTADELRTLRDMGHLIGSHSCSHPEPMSACGPDELVSEWSQSCAALTEILGEQIVLGSVPGGYYSAKVGRSAAAAGIRGLFTSEPRVSTTYLEGCVLFGRFAVTRHTTADRTVQLASRKRLPRFQQFASWNGKKAAKRLGGPAYLRLRTALLDRPG